MKLPPRQLKCFERLWKSSCTFRLPRCFRVGTGLPPGCRRGLSSLMLEVPVFWCVGAPTVGVRFSLPFHDHGMVARWRPGRVHVTGQRGPRLAEVAAFSACCGALSVNTENCTCTLKGPGLSSAGGDCRQLLKPHLVPCAILGMPTGHHLQTKNMPRQCCCHSFHHGNISLIFQCCFQDD